ncbi:hypothetical protein P3547_19890 [Vibrio parahaemolyticus]|nr:hypothetical protein [Vibrio parahaemolyticus]
MASTATSTNQFSMSFANAMQLMIMLAVVMSSYFVTDANVKMNTQMIAQNKATQEARMLQMSNEFDLKLQQVNSAREADMQRFIESTDRLSGQIDKLTQRIDVMFSKDGGHP